MDANKDKISIKAYRPWDTTVLESTVNSEELVTKSQEQTKPEQGKLKKELLPELEDLYLENNNDGMEEKARTSISNYDENLEQIKNNIEGLISNKSDEIDTIKETLDNPGNTKLVVGGFFKPQMHKETADNSGQQINTLIQDLEKKEFEIQILNNNLKATQAIENAERAEISRKQEEQARKILEEKLKVSLRESSKMGKQLRLAIEQLKVAEISIKEEQAARQHANQELQTYSSSHKKLLEQHKILDEKYISTIDKLNRITDDLESLTREHNIALNVKEKLASEIKSKNEELFSKYKIIQKNEQEIEEKNTYIEKLKNIVEQEQSVRKLSDDKTKKASDELEKIKSISDKRLDQIKLELETVKKKAKLAIAQANRTMMEFFNSTGNDKTQTKP